MARQRSEYVEEVKRQLYARLKNGLQPGEKFLSTRTVARDFHISYQTAHRILRELHDEGHLERRAASGTFASGQSSARNGVQLVFNRRAERSGSFGERLLREMTTRLEDEKIAHILTFADEEISLDESRFCVIWESSAAIAQCLKARAPALLLNDRPPPGLTSSLVDSVSCDDFSGGASAAQLLMKAFSQARNESESKLNSKKSDGKKAKKTRRNRPGFAILSGPSHDVRSEQRVAGFLSQMNDAKVVVPRGWFIEDGLQVADRVLESGRDGVFLLQRPLGRSDFRALPRAPFAASANCRFR